MAFDKYYLDKSGKPYQGVYEESLTQKFLIGERYAEPGPLGRVFRYAQNGLVALAPGYLLSGAAFAGAATAVQAALAVAADAAVGATRVYITFANAQVADRFAGGLVTFTDGTAATRFETYAIKSNTAGTTGVYLDLYDGLKTALVAGSELAYVSANPWMATVLCATTQLNMPVGVSLGIVQASYWFWCQTWGPVGVYNKEGVLVAGRNVLNSSTSAGGVITDTGALVDSIVGATQQIGVDEHCGLIYLRIAP